MYIFPLELIHIFLIPPSEVDTDNIGLFCLKYEIRTISSRNNKSILVQYLY